MQLVKILITMLLTIGVAKAETIELVVPYVAGGATDMIAREVQQKINNKFPGLAVVINKPGAEGTIATQYFFNAQSNKILVVGTATTIYQKLQNPTITYDPINDFQIASLVTTPTMLIVNKKLKVNDLDDFVQQAKTRNLNCGTSNVFGLFVGRYFAYTHKLNITFVPYKGSPAVLTDLLGGHIDCSFDTLPAYLGRPEFKILGLSASDTTENFNAPVLFKTDYRFENYLGVALGKTIEPQLRKQLTQILIDMSTDKKFIKEMRDRGFAVNPDINLTYSSKLNKDYNYLQHLNQRMLLTQ